MCTGSILRKMILFAVPLMCSGVLQLLFNAADIIVVGRFAGDNSLAAVGSTAALIGLLTNLFIGLSVGGNVLTAHYYGAKKPDHLKETIHTAITLSIVSGLILTVVGVFGARGILTLMDTPPEVLEKAVLYLRIYFGGMTATMVYNFGSAILRAFGDTKRPLYFLSFAGVMNVILNLIFVIVFHMDVAGVALATIISQCISVCLVIRCLMHEREEIRLITSFYFLAGMMDVVVGSLRGLGHSVFPMIVSLVGVCGLRLLWVSTIFQMEAFHTPFGIYMTYPISWALTFLVLLVGFYKIRKKLSRDWGV